MLKDTEINSKGQSWTNDAQSDSFSDLVRVSGYLVLHTARSLPNDRFSRRLATNADRKMISCLSQTSDRRDLGFQEWRAFLWRL